MNEFTGAVLKGQVQKLDTICTALRANAKKVREGIADLPGLKLRKSPDVEGDLGVDRLPRLGHQGAARQVPAGAAGRGHQWLGAGRLGDPARRQPDREQGDHPSRLALVQQPQGKAIQYGAESCPRTIDILGRIGGVIMDPSYTDDDVKDIVRAIRKVYLAMRTA